MRYTVSLRQFRIVVILCLVMVVVYLITVATQTSAHHDTLVYLTFGINGAIWTILLFKEIVRRAYSLNMVHWVFCLFFFFFAGLIQTMNNKFPWIGTYDDNTLLKTNVVLLLWTVFFQTGYVLANRFKIMRTYIKHEVALYESVDSIQRYDLKVIILTVFAVLITWYRVVTIGFINLLARGTSVSAVSDNTSISTFVDKTALAIVYFAFIFSIFLFQRKKEPILLIINGICLLVSYFPTSVSRNAAAGLYFGALLAMFPNARKKRWFAILYILVFIVVFPLLNAFRTVAVTDVNLIIAFRNTLNNLSSGWLAVDYDAYSMVALTLHYVTAHGITWGHQLLGVFCFWIPRSIWPTKPIASGPLVAEYNGWWFTNVSEPLPAEMVINFGVLGMIISAVIIGYIINKLDIYHWKHLDTYGTTARRYDALYFYMIGYAMFLYRGALLSATAYLIPFVVIWIVIVGRNHQTIRS